MPIRDSKSAKVDPVEPPEAPLVNLDGVGSCGAGGNGAAKAHGPSKDTPLNWTAAYRIAARAGRAMLEQSAEKEEQSVPAIDSDVHRRLRDFVQSACDWVWETDEHAALTHVSERIGQFVGRPPSELKGMYLTDIGQNAAEHGDGSLRALLKARRPFRDKVLEICDTEGRTRRCALSGVPFFDDASGRFLGYRGTGTDITSRFEVEQAAERYRYRLEQALEEIRNKNMYLELALNDATDAARAKNDFLAIVSHELRTPLNAIVGFTDIMAREMFGPVENDRYKDYLGNISESADHLLGIIADIMDMSKIESGQLRVEDAVLEVPDVIHSAWKLMADRANGKGVQFATILPDRMPRLQADERIVRQMLLNLFSNGIKFTPEGGSITVGAGLLPDGGFAIRVSDTGVGIDKKDFATVLTPFGQVVNTYKRTREGTGLGLPLVRSMIEMHSGHLELQSERNVGTTVTLAFPADRVIDE